ncbi:MAG: sulfatase-like hydrolase/transferase [Proteobacteria bacterium]|nr:sulfatase-like hydrolase/transferase [Pseudomonadota bacterium]
MARVDLAVVIGAWMTAMACSGDEAPEPTPAAPETPPAESREPSGGGPDPATLPDVLVVVLDTTGPKVISEHMPNAQAFIDAGRSYTHAISPSNSTMEAVAAVFTGVPMSNARLWDEGTTTLPERLTQRGYHGFIGSANPVLDHPFYKRGFERTHVRLQDIRPDFPDAGLVDAFEAAWTELPQPRFGWLQMIACHDYRIAKKDYIEEGWASGEAERAEAWDAYVQDCKATDELLTRVLGANEGGLTVLTADHGELFAQHGSYVLPKQAEHGHGLSDSPMEIHVPLALQGPGVEPAKIHSPTSVLDLHSTLSEIVGVMTPGGDLRTGSDLRPAVSAGCDVYERATGRYGVVVRDDGTHVVRVEGPKDVPTLFRWDPRAGVGLQPAVAIKPDELNAVESGLLWGEAKLECVDDQELCARHPEISSLGYIECQ